MRGVRFVNLQCRSESGIYLRGSKGAPLEDIGFRGIDLTITKTTPIEGGFYDMRPGDAFGSSGLDRRQTSGFFAADVNGLYLDDVGVHWGENAPSYYGPAIELHDCTNVSAVQLTGSAAHAGVAPAVLENVTYAPTIVMHQEKP